MPPARPRPAAVDDTRSETSLNASRAVSGHTVARSKKTNASTLNGTSTIARAVVATKNPASITATAAGNVESTHDHPHVDWSILPTYALHSYRSAYRLQYIPSYYRPHADILYKSCDLAARAPSQVLKRRKEHDLKLYRKKQAQTSSETRARANGVAKRPSKLKDPRRKSSKQNDTSAGTDNAHPSIEEPPSPSSHPSHPSQHDSVSNHADAASRKSPKDPTDVVMADEQEALNTIPSSLYQSNPENTTIGSQSPNSLATMLRKHFNAQPIIEADTIARFAYVVRQQGSISASRVQPLAQRLTLPLPTTTAENIAALAEAANANPAAAAVVAAASSAAGTSTGAVASTGTTAPAKTNAHVVHIAATRVIGGQHVEAEGSYGDGKGHIMGTTSCGRQVRIQDGGGTGTFRLRFRP